MNNRYLYRAKRSDNGEWVEGYYVKRHGVPMIYENRDCPQSIYEIDPSTICQCTGLKDKNGKLIWENDIIEAHLDNLFPEDISRFQVLWKDYSFKIRLEKELYDDFSDDLSELFEVAGNIFDNQELLEVGE